MGQEATTQIAKATEFTIPVSPAFDLLAVSPSQITRPNNIREFKVDWSFRSWRLKPNIAIQAQPIWELAYNRPDLGKYRRASRLMKTLSTLDLSAGTIEDADQSRRASLAAKLNLFRQYDPLEEVALFTKMDSVYRKRQDATLVKMAMVKLKRDATTDKQALARYDNSLDSLQGIYDAEAMAQKERIQAVAQQYILDHWNAAHLDVAVGKLYAYENAALDSLNLRAAGAAVWVNGSLPIGKRLMLNGTVKYMKQVAQDSFSTRFNTTSGGIGMRYGSPKFTFFVEFVFSKFKTDTNLSIEEMPELNMAQLNNFSTSYGGDWRINRNVLLSYGVRLDHSDGYRVKNIIPVAGVSCMMR
jgi:hypothetical protein